MKTGKVPYLLEQLSVDLCSQGVKIDTALSYGVKVLLGVRYEPVSEKHDQAHVVVERVMVAENRSLCGEQMAVEIDAGTNVFHLIPRSQIEAIEENLLAIMAGEN